MGSGSSPLEGKKMVFKKGIKTFKLKKLLKLKFHQTTENFMEISPNFWFTIATIYKNLTYINLQKIFLNIQVVDELFTRIIFNKGSTLFLLPKIKINKYYYYLEHFYKTTGEDSYFGDWINGYLTNRAENSIPSILLFGKKYDYDLLFLFGLENRYNGVLREFNKISLAPVVGLLSNTGKMNYIDYLLINLSQKHQYIKEIQYLFLNFIVKTIFFNKFLNINSDYSKIYFHYLTTSIKY